MHAQRGSPGLVGQSLSNGFLRFRPRAPTKRETTRTHCKGSQQMYKTVLMLVRVYVGVHMRLNNNNNRSQPQEENKSFFRSLGNCGRE